MAPTQCDFVTGAGSDTECHVAPEVPPDNRATPAVEDQSGGQFYYYQQQPESMPDGSMAQYYQQGPPQTTSAPHLFYPVPVPATSMQPLTIQTAMPAMSNAQPVTWPPTNAFQPIGSPPENLNINAAPFQPSGNNSAATTASSSPVSFAHQPLAVQIPPVMYANQVPGAMGGMYGPVSDPNGAYHPMQMYLQQYGMIAPYQVHQFALPEAQYQLATSSNGSSPAPAYQAPSYHGSPAPQMPPVPHTVAPAIAQHQPQIYHEPTTMTLVNGLSRLNLTNAPMFQPPKGHNLSQPSDMKEKWHGEFDKKFAIFGGHQWTLDVAPEGYHGPHDGIFEDSAKIRFICKSCSNAWTSMQGKVKFWYHLDKNTQQGSIHFQLFGQKCKKCKQNRNLDSLQDPLWYPDEIEKVVHNIHAVVGNRYYGMQLAQIQIQRRMGHPKGQHDSTLCDACEKGLCRRNSPNPNI